MYQFLAIFTKSISTIYPKIQQLTLAAILLKKKSPLPLSSSSLQQCQEMDLKNFHATEMKLPPCDTFNIFLKPRQTLHQKAYKHLEYLWKSEVSTLPHLDMDSVTGYDHIKIIIDQVRKISGFI